ncbi:MAG: hypothetical protein SF123_04035 [Chloroflexota bacterium]|nr:hypothetical protein [Chloroflexota bacterium]
MRLLRWLVLLIMLMATGCAGLGSGTQTVVDMPAQVTAFASEMTQMPVTLAVQGTQVAATVAAAETYVADRRAVNVQIVGTLRAAMPATQQIVQAGDPNLSFGTVLPSDGAALGGAGAATPPPAASGLIQFSPLQLATAVRESDACAETVVNAIDASATIMYVTTRAANMRAGTEMSAEWSYGGQVVYSWSFTVEVDDDDFCLWFGITPADAPFTPGDWSVRILANGAPIGAALNFQIVEAM